MRSKNVVALFMQSGSRVITLRLIQEIDGQNVCLNKAIINCVLMYGYRGQRHTERFIECNVYLIPKEIKK